MADASEAKPSQPEVPLVAAAGPTGKAATLRPVASVVRFVSLALLLSGGILGPFFKANPTTAVLVIFGGFAAGMVLTIVRMFTLDVYVTRRIGRADVFADKVVIYKNDITYEVPWKKVKNVLVKPAYVQLVIRGDLFSAGVRAIPCSDPAAASQIVDIWRQHGRPAPANGAEASPAPAPLAPIGGERLLVASGGAGWKKAKVWINVGLVAIYMAALFQDDLRRHGAAWMPRFSTGRWELDFLILIVSFRFVRGWAMRFTNARIGRAEFFPDAIKFFAGDDATTVAWSEVTGFDDGSADFVRVLRRGARLGESLSVPTPTEDLRVRVLDLFEQKGIPRSDAAGLVS